MTDQEQNANVNAAPDEPTVDAMPETAEETPIETPMERFFYHQRRALEETGKALEALLPPDFRKHGAEASREFGRGFRVLVDAAIDELKRVSERDDEDHNEVKDKKEDDATVEETQPAKSEPTVVEVDTDGDGGDDEPPSSTGKTKVRVRLE